MFVAGPSVHPATGDLTYPPAPNMHGTAILTLALRDNGGSLQGGQDTSELHTITLTVLPVNDPPSFHRGQDQVVLEDAGPQTVVGWASELSAGPPNESLQTLAFEILANSHPGLFAEGPHVDPVTGNLTFTSTPDASGSATIRLRLVDDGGTERDGNDASQGYEFAITVQAVPDAGVVVLAATSPTVPEKLPGAVVTAVRIDDPDPGDTHFFEVSDPRFEIVGGELRLKAGVMLNWNTERSIPLTLTVTEAFGLRVEENLVLTVTINNAWRNAVSRWDVNADGFVTPLDALAAILVYNRDGVRALPYPPPSPPSLYLDVDGDNWHTPTDIIAVINHINLQLELAAGEGESPATSPSPMPVLIERSELEPPPPGVQQPHLALAAAVQVAPQPAADARGSEVPPPVLRPGVGPAESRLPPAPGARGGASVFDQQGLAEDLDALLDDLAVDVHSAWSQYEDPFA